MRERKRDRKMAGEIRVRERGRNRPKKGEIENEKERRGEDIIKEESKGKKVGCSDINKCRGN